jgi:hypothetical protein
MIIWGGRAGDSFLNDGARYHPGQNRWAPLPTINAPSPRGQHSAVWTGTEMIVWGGQNADTSFKTGGRFNLVANAWSPTTTTNVPTARHEHSAVWTGSEMILWGGHDRTAAFLTGARYDPLADRWNGITTTKAPTRRWGHSSIWTGAEMLVWGGIDGAIPFNDTVMFNLFNDTYSYTPTPPSSRSSVVVVRIGGNMTISFPTITGYSYTLWRSDALAPGAWTNTGFPALVGNGNIGTFFVPLGPATSGFFRVQASR